MSVHSSHCCIHQCKYSESDCAVVSKREIQEYPCDPQDCYVAMALTELDLTASHIVDENVQNTHFYRAPDLSVETGWYLHKLSLQLNVPVDELLETIVAEKFVSTFPDEVNYL